MMIMIVTDNISSGDGDTPEAGDNRLYGHGVGVDPGGGASGDWSLGNTDQHQPLSDIMPDIAMAGKEVNFEILPYKCQTLL